MPPLMVWPGAEEARRILQKSTYADLLSAKWVVRNPMGTRNGKTASPGTYRPVGVTCPSTCPHLGVDCYAQEGRVMLAQRRAEGALAPSLWSVVVALEVARRDHSMARIHVSGDFMLEGKVDRVYAEHVLQICKAYGGTRDRPTAWGYTAIREADLGTRLLDRMWEAGLALRLSGAEGSRGALVVDAEDKEDFRRQARELGGFACPAQLGASVTCRSAGYCCARVDKPVVFNRHGMSGDRIRRQALERRRGRLQVLLDGDRLSEASSAPTAAA